MNDHRNYGKIHRLGKEETEGILIGTVAVQEKVDGANVSIWLDDEDNLKMGSRTRILRDDEEFNGFVPYVKAHEGIRKLLEMNPNFRLYGEWLVRHTIAYKETTYRKFYLFDVYVDDYKDSVVPEDERWKTWADVKMLGEAFGIDTVPMHGEFENPTVEALMEFVGKSEFGDRGEGIVLKNLDFKNTFGDMCFAKIVTETFKEDNAVAFGGNNKYSDTYWEMYVVNKYMTLPRIKKIMDKIQPELNERLDMKHIPRIMGTAYHDMLTEEIWEIAGKVASLDFKALERCANKKAKQIYVDILNESISVADLHA
jgi:hypothetical protein